MGLLTWAMLLLATHTEWQEKARKEVFDIFGEKHPNTDNSSMAKMKIVSIELAHRRALAICKTARVS
ncbi:hypothetical protein FRX31_006742 [Thalictrum thalictroides]|uniref:Uncharacterized protein n=1 Tax=Thalictrum thalictroides TaxID=46969 RepID=A0A7J6X4C8_THATH|nr:hypothetical protein FRX31_006742 [Thalictrum thalictroides]